MIDSVEMEGQCGSGDMKHALWGGGIRADLNERQEPAGQRLEEGVPDRGDSKYDGPGVGTMPVKLEWGELGGEGVKIHWKRWWGTLRQDVQVLARSCCLPRKIVVLVSSPRCSWSSQKNLPRSLSNRQSLLEILIHRSKLRPTDLSL